MYRQTMTSVACEIWKLFLVAFSVPDYVIWCFGAQFYHPMGCTTSLQKRPSRFAGHHITNVTRHLLPPCISGKSNAGILLREKLLIHPHDPLELGSQLLTRPAVQVVDPSLPTLG
jgi:hypothetical protein